MCKLVTCASSEWYEIRCWGLDETAMVTIIEMSNNLNCNYGYECMHNFGWFVYHECEVLPLLVALHSILKYRILLEFVNIVYVVYIFPIKTH